MDGAAAAEERSSEDIAAVAQDTLDKPNGGSTGVGDASASPEDDNKFQTAIAAWRST